MEKKEKKSKTARTWKAADVAEAYRIIAAKKQGETAGFTFDREMPTKDIFAVLRTMKAMKGIAESLDDFRKDAQERLQPDNWDEIMEKIGKYADLPDNEKAEVTQIINTLEGKVRECMTPELDRQVTLDGSERIGKESFALLLKANSPHLIDASSALLLADILCEE